MADSIVNKFVFPPDRFPSLSLKPECSFDQEEFGPPLTFDLNSSECRELQDYQEVGFEFTPTPDEIARKQMEILYSVEGDDYLRPNSPQSRIFRWNSGVFRSFNIQKTVENDWRMAYLSRKCVAVGDNRGNNLCGLIEWRFNLEGYGMRVKKLFVRLPHQTYRDGKVRVLICSRNDYAVIMDPHNLKPVFRAYGWQDFVLRVELSGEKSDDTCENTYQNAQLFRQPCPQLASNPDWKHPFKIILEMEPAESLNLLMVLTRVRLSQSVKHDLVATRNCTGYLNPERCFGCTLNSQIRQGHSHQIRCLDSVGKIINVLTGIQRCFVQNGSCNF